ncbi:MAG TPA: hypothetical protein VK563_20905 [Puia sp.]|nr:hypothetical protein [Puia sp.]
MPSDLKSSICYLEETNDPASAYFCFAVDSTGEYGIIKANKEGLRLYAAEILKKSLLLEDLKDGEPIFFGDLEWVVSDAGYDVVAGIQPQYLTRSEILGVDVKGEEPEPVTLHEHQEQAADTAAKKSPATGKGCLVLALCIMGSLILLATILAFPNLRSWVNIH